MVKADISLFYPSTYTHSIPWALHGKTASKNNQSHALLGNRLDTAIRRSQYGQTVGIPIGPDTSFIIAEAILSRVDERIQERLPKIDGYRLIDDYEFACGSEAEAEAVVAVLRSALGEFELQLNSGKTRIIRAPLSLVSPWVADLRSFPIRTSSAGQADDLVEYFDRAARVGQMERTAAPLKFATGRLRQITVDGSNWPILQYLLFQALLTEPAVIRNAFNVIWLHVRRGLPLDREGFARCLSEVVRRHAPQHGSSEVAWALWSAILFEIDLPDDVGAAVSQLDDDVVAILALDAARRGRVNLNTTHWLSLISAAELRGEHWLLSYEAAVKGWLGSPAHLGSHPEFDALHHWGVEFYDSDFWVNLTQTPLPSTPTLPRLRRVDTTEGRNVVVDVQSDDDWELYPF